VTQTWIGKSGIWLQFLVAVLFALCISVLVYGITVELAPGNDDPGALGLVIFMVIVILLFLGGAIWLVFYLRPVTLTVYGEGVTWTKGSKTKTIAFRDIQSVDEALGRFGGGGSILFFPTAEFLAETGDKAKPGKASFHWTISGWAFSSKQKKEFLPAIQQAIGQSGPMR